jgi:hypothetical protein
MIFSQRQDNAKMRARTGRQISRLEIGLAFVFGCLALAAVLWLAFRSDSLNDQQFEIVRIVIALAGSGVGAVIPGFLDVTLKAGTRLALRAGGALAVFVVLYFWSPAHWNSQHTEGAGSPIQSGKGNKAIYNGPVGR